MAEKDPRIGTILPNGRREFPARTLFGRRYDRATAAVTGLDAAHFVVLDNRLPEGADVEAELAQRRAALAPTPVEDEKPAARKGKAAEDERGS